MPGLQAVRSYRREWLARDVVAEVVLTTLLVPQGMAYAELAGLPSITGLYTSILCLLGYVVVDPFRILVLGPDSSLRPMIAAAILPLIGAGGDAKRGWPEGPSGDKAFRGRPRRQFDAKSDWPCRSLRRLNYAAFLSGGDGASSPRPDEAKAECYGRALARQPHRCRGSPALSLTSTGAREPPDDQLRERIRDPAIGLGVRLTVLRGGERHVRLPDAPAERLPADCASRLPRRWL